MKRIYDALFYFNVGMIISCIALAWMLQVPGLATPCMWFALAACAFRIASQWKDIKKYGNRFRVANRKWWVVYEQSLADDARGETDFEAGAVRILGSLSHEQRVHTLLHELVHIIADAMGWPKLDKREHKVDALAGLLAQALETMEGEL